MNRKRKSEKNWEGMMVGREGRASRDKKGGKGGKGREARGGGG